MPSNFWVYDGKWQPSPGSEITQCVHEAVDLAANEGRLMSFDFNGVNIAVEGDSDPVLVLRDFWRTIDGCICGVVGPHPARELTDAEKAHDAKVCAAKAKRQAEQAAAWQAKEDAKAEMLAARLLNAGPIDLADTDRWNAFCENNRDVYGRAVMKYAEQWARLMQLEMANGAALENIADEAGREADAGIGGITGFQYGCAVQTLATCWKYGERLRRWHNLKTQIKYEGERANEDGGVLNPATLVLGG